MKEHTESCFVSQEEGTTTYGRSEGHPSVLLFYYQDRKQQNLSILHQTAFVPDKANIRCPQPQLIY